jgi:peptide deformylase
MIITFDEEKLRSKCEDVLPEEVDDLVAKLEYELDQSNKIGNSGIGLAATQIGISKNIAIIRLGGTNLNLVNCKIKNAYNPTIFKNEGCLSFPNITKDTTRFQEVHVVNNLVYPHSFVASGLLAVVVQHELDHLNEVLFLDHEVKRPTQVINKIKTRPNDPCFCGSKKKYKKCCQDKD